MSTRIVWGDENLLETTGPSPSRAYSKQEHKNARAMMRRIESLTREMPDVFFKHRNFFTKVGLAADGKTRSPPREPTEGFYQHELSSGHKMIFTGAFATAPFLRALGHDIVRPARQVSMDPEEGQNLGKRDKVLSKRETRRAKRTLQALKAIAPDSDNGDGDRPESSQGTPSFYFGPLEIKSPQPTTGAQTAAAEQQHRATSSVAADGSSQPTVAGTSDVDDEDTDAPEDSSIRGIFKERTRKGKTEYLVDWEPASDGEEYDPS
ncbi:MAG: hypothetical protein LQ341_004760 [Variospora aurantia]|nr:MAG: hypothetical protein LQ341_004760 [Variospora aurantia]